MIISKEYDEKNESHENFLKGTNFEAKLTDEDFDDSLHKGNYTRLYTDASRELINDLRKDLTVTVQPIRIVGMTNK